MIKNKILKQLYFFSVYVLYHNIVTHDEYRTKHNTIITEFQREVLSPCLRKYTVPIPNYDWKITMI